MSETTITQDPATDQQWPRTMGVLNVLTKARLLDLARRFDVEVPARASKEALVELLHAQASLPFHGLLEWMSRDELKAACRSYRIDDSGRSRAALVARLLEARPGAASVRPKLIFDPAVPIARVPKRGSIVHLRHRQYLVEEVIPPPAPGHATVVKMVCLDDDAQGRPLDVLWELELGARVADEERLPTPQNVDFPREFGAYLHAVKWNCVTATNARLFQAPFRAGIKLMHHQLTPLTKALSLPRANLFIADDVGLGKTIEAGLIVQELELRQRIQFVLIVCPASISLQWRDEMERRFGQTFVLYNRAFVARRRQERGFAVNPWATHNRFIISYQTLRRPDYQDPLLQHLREAGARFPKSLLILDEAHTIAPASATRIAVDTQQTRVVRELAKSFENRLFLSATPHNGHSNSFSALLEILDPQRFTRGVKVRGSRQLDPVMVRRLKGDLRDLAVSDFPVRRVVQIALKADNGAWQAVYFARVVEEGGQTDTRLREAALGPARTSEVELTALLQQYSKLMRPTKGVGQLVFINLQKRLLSSIEAFHRTLRLHAEAVAQGKAKTALQLRLGDADEDEYGPDEDTLDNLADAEAARCSALLAQPEGKARELLDKMLQLSAQQRTAPDGKVLALLEWIQRNLCPAVSLGGAATGASRSWSKRRVIIFTEYADTKRYLLQILRSAIEGSERDDERLMELHGGIGDERRAEIQRAFNGDPDEYPVRILLATDAAREGINLQAHCSDLFHFDVPWNPARMEQRNGRIDRTLQPEKYVHCHYFAYPERSEDAVLARLVNKVDTIQRELGSLGSVVMERMAEVLETGGIDDATAARLEALGQGEERIEEVREELERQTREQKRLLREIEEAGRILEQSRKTIDFKPAHLKDLVNAGLALGGFEALKPVPRETNLFRIPDLPDTWARTLDSLRPPRAKDQLLWEWRREHPPLPVTFEPLERMAEDRVQLHLQHPFVKRLLARFLAQGFSAHDLHRITIVRSSEHSVPRVVAIGRVSLFGRGASRLHDELVAVSAEWSGESGAGAAGHEGARERQALRELEGLLREARAETVPPKVQARVLAAARSDFDKLWPLIRDEAETLAHKASQQLAERAAAEADALREILEGQRSAIEKELSVRRQLPLALQGGPQNELRQFQDELDYMQQRLALIDRELVEEPAQIEALYQVLKQRLTPIGMAYIWPAGMG